MSDDWDDESCASACDELIQRQVEDDEVSYDFSLRYAACVNRHCESVAENDGLCYSALQLHWDQGQECHVEDTEIVEIVRN